MSENKEITIKPTISGFFNFIMSSRRSLVFYSVLILLTVFNPAALVSMVFVTLVIYFNYRRQIRNKNAKEIKPSVIKADVTFRNFVLGSFWNWGGYFAFLGDLVRGRITEAVLLVIGYTVFLYIEFRSYKKKMLKGI